MFGMYKLTVQLFLGELPFNFVHYSFFFSLFSVCMGQDPLSLQVPGILAVSNEGRPSVRWSCVWTHTHTHRLTGLRGMRITTYSVCFYAYIECTHSHTDIYIRTHSL